MGLNEYPELKATFDALQAEKAKIQAVSTPLRAERDALEEEMLPGRLRVKELNQAVREIELPRLAQIDRQLAALARASGGRRMSEEGK